MAASSGPAGLYITGLVILGLVVLCAGCSEIPIDPRYLSTSSEYSLDILTNEPLSDVTFYLPLPVKNGTPVTGDIVLTPDLFEKAGFTVSFEESPPAWNFTGIYVRPENPPVWIRIHADRVLPVVSGHEYSVRIPGRTRQKSPLTFSDTVYPVGNQSVFMPKLQFSSPVVTRIPSNKSHIIRYTPVKVLHKIPVYAEYSASPTAFVEIVSMNSRSNSWLESYDVYQWNNYYDIFEWQHTGPSHGWQLAGGTFIAAEGSYPDITDPVWEKMARESLQ